ncbi:MAG: hypothetical protein LR015_06790 [Verrucomicrobia bacterium]|nr:hypothetical protein [Verrucomicrobiota bacterium]
MYTNIIHRVDTAMSSLRALEYQRRLAFEMELPVTTLITYNALFDDSVMEGVMALQGGELEEFGLHFWSYQGERFRQKYGNRETALWLLPRNLRTEFIAEMMEGFRARFGRYLLHWVVTSWMRGHCRGSSKGIRR